VFALFVFVSEFRFQSVPQSVSSVLFSLVHGVARHANGLRQRVKVDTFESATAPQFSRFYCQSVLFELLYHVSHGFDTTPRFLC
jgi:hypothetical protein